MYKDNIIFLTIMFLGFFFLYFIYPSNTTANSGEELQQKVKTKTEWVWATVRCDNIYTANGRISKDTLEKPSKMFIESGTRRIVYVPDKCLVFLRDSLPI